MSAMNFELFHRIKIFKDISAISLFYLFLCHPFVGLKRRSKVDHKVNRNFGSFFPSDQLSFALEIFTNTTIFRGTSASDKITLLPPPSQIFDCKTAFFRRLTSLQGAVSRHISIESIRLHLMIHL